MVLFPPPFYFVFYISNLLSYIQNNFSYELARPIMGTIFLVNTVGLQLSEHVGTEGCSDKGNVRITEVAFLNTHKLLRITLVGVQ